MTRRGETSTPVALRRQIARLMQIHNETHPVRIARRVGLSAQYVRRLWREMPLDSMPPETDALPMILSDLTFVRGR